MATSGAEPGGGSATRAPARRSGPLVPILLSLGATLVGLAIFASAGAARTGFPLDDAWIHRVYARSIALGRGLAYQDGGLEAGSTSPLWALVSAPAEWVGSLGLAWAVGGVKVIGALLALAVAAGTAWLAARGGPRWSGLVAGLLVASDPRLLFSALSGMETALVVALWVGMAVALAGGRPTVALVALGLLPTARPEALVVVPFGVLAWWFERRGLDGRAPGPRSLGAAGLVLGAPFAAWMVFCRFANGHWLPTTFYVKGRLVELRWATVTGALGQHGWAAATTVLGLGLAGLLLLAWRRREPRDAILFGAAPVAYLVAVAASRYLSPGGYYWSRWVDPAAIVLVVGAALGCDALVAGRVLGRSQAGRIAGPALVGLALLVGWSPWWGSAVGLRAHLVGDARAIDRLNVSTGLWVREHTPGDAVIAVNDAGAIRYVGGRRTVDLLGLNFAPLAFGAVSPGDVIAGADWLAVFPTWIEDLDLAAAVAESFTARATFEVPLEEYTVCFCPGQTTIVVYERTAPRS